MRPVVALRVFLAVAALAALVTGLMGGLARLGLIEPIGTFADLHGALMASGFFGTLISLERAAADGRPAALVVPGVSAVGAVLLWLDRPADAGLMFLVAGLGLTALTARAAVALPRLFTILMTVGAALWPIGTAYWLAGRTLPEVGYVWLGFLIVTVAAERIELSRLTRPTLAAEATLIAIVAAFAAALALGEPWNGHVLLSLSLAALALWLLGQDIAVRTLRTVGFPRFAAVLLLTGYGWLAVAAAIFAFLTPGVATFGHDAAIHAIAVGFVLSMVFAHAPIILPAIVGLDVRYSPWLYGPAALLQLATVLRVTGDGLENTEMTAHAACLSVVSLVLYVGLLMATRFVRCRKPATA